MSQHRRGNIRWDRIGRIGLLCTLTVIVLLYLSPASHWLEQSRTSSRQQDELGELMRENSQLKRRVNDLRSPGALEREARRLGMVRQGERSFVIENLRGR